MPRPKSANVVQVTFKIPQEWVDRFNHLGVCASKATRLTINAAVSRAHIMRQALCLGLEDFEDAYGVQRGDRAHGSKAVAKKRKTKT